MTGAGTRSMPVVGVGNLAMGGRAKTPVAAHIAEWLVARGERPAILSRGYARENPTDEVVVVSDGRHQLADLARSGDEPLLLARRVPGARVLVHPVRARAAAYAEAHLSATVHVLDDGFQHRSLVRDIDIVIVRPEDLRGRRMPFGRLRSPVSALGRAHAVIVDGATLDEAERSLAGIVDRARTRVFTLERSVGEPWWVDGHADQAERPAHMAPVVVVAAIAGPEQFVRALADTGWSVADLVAFPDHHAFSRRDIARVNAAVGASGSAGVVTTEKDAMRLLPLRPLPWPVAAVPLRVTVAPAAAFDAWLAEQLEAARCRR
jgi:tetraacyldisaccharide 4'-kinase